MIDALDHRLAACATAQTRTFWERYLKGAVPFRGVPMAGVRRAVHSWWNDDGPAGLAVPAQKALALALFEGRYCEDKLAGTLVLQEILLGHLNDEDIDAFGRLFERACIADWNTCDWFCVKVLGPLVARDVPRRHRVDLITAWKCAPTVWQRRSANVAFVNLARRGDANFPGFTALMLDTCAATVCHEERFAQTGVGWLLRELAEADCEAVTAFTRAHLARMSREAVRYVTERMPHDQRRALLDAHTRARGRSMRREVATHVTPTDASPSGPSIG